MLSNPSEQEHISCPCEHLPSGRLWMESYCISWISLDKCSHCTRRALPIINPLNCSVLAHREETYRSDSRFSYNMPPKQQCASKGSLLITPPPNKREKKKKTFTKIKNLDLVMRYSNQENVYFEVTIRRRGNWISNANSVIKTRGLNSCG